MGKGVKSILFEGIWLSELAYIKATLVLLGLGKPWQEASGDEPTKKKRRTDDDEEEEEEEEKTEVKDSTDDMVVEDVADGQNFWPTITEELILMIFGMLDPKDLLSLGRADKFLSKLANNDALWTKIYAPEDLDVDDGSTKKKKKKKKQKGEGALRSLLGQFPSKHLYFVEKDLASGFKTSLETISWDIPDASAVLNCVCSLVRKGITIVRLRSGHESDSDITTNGFLITSDAGGWDTESLTVMSVEGSEHWSVLALGGEDKLPSLTQKQIDAIKRFAVDDLRITEGLTWAMAMCVTLHGEDNFLARKIKNLDCTKEL